MKTTEPIIVFENAHKSLGGQAILRGVNLTLNHGEVLSVVGPSGTGKSVLLRHIVGFHTLDYGTLIVDGQEPGMLSESELLHYRAKIGYLFQSGALLAWMNLFDNVALPLRERTKYTISDTELHDNVMLVLEKVGLADHAGKYPSEISGGMCKRAGLARALVTCPSILLCDEPTSGLDPVMSRRIDDLLLELHRELGMTIVAVTHDLISAFRISDRIAMLRGGEIAVCGTPEAFRHSNVPEVQEFIKAQEGL